MTTQKAINWSQEFLPGLTDNFISNELYTREVNAETIWPLLEDPFMWPTYYKGASDIKFKETGSKLQLGTKFSFKIFGLLIECECIEFQPPQGTKEGRIAWIGYSENKKKEKVFECVHAWLIENLPQGITRILSQESQKGDTAKKVNQSKSNEMLISYQSWLHGLVEKADISKESLLSKII